MTEWTVVTVLIALIGLFVTVGKPIIALNGNLTKLNMRLEQTEREQRETTDALREQKEKAHESHKQLWTKNAEQDDRLDDHEKRISHLEGEHRIYHKDA